MRRPQYSAGFTGDNREAARAPFGRSRAPVLGAQAEAVFVSNAAVSQAGAPRSTTKKRSTSLNLLQPGVARVMARNVSYSQDDQFEEVLNAQA